jgi:hypothetical protein
MVLRVASQWEIAFLSVIWQLPDMDYFLEPSKKTCCTEMQNHYLFAHHFYQDAGYKPVSIHWGTHVTFLCH